ncbi:cobalamin B12-binding domain-containing protein [Streptomyces phytophilus]|uniref:cobalamin B12-binding domain-containing protein n=1 Tax=Streptomyces phytophilus TaxID=722715 RepID=UPI0015F0CB1F|nr:cobalamin-dependent protein [Streptomyces phytophilus]
MSDTRITEAARASFDACLAAADEDAAIELAVGLVARGVSAQDVLLHLVAPAQVRVGERWESGEWTVAQEHAATHVSRRTVDEVASAARGTARPPAGGAGARGRVLVACSDGEWHVLPARILTEVLRLHGFDVRSLGGSVSPQGMLSDVHQNGPDVVALSCTLPWNLPLAYRQIEICRWAGVPVIAGGPGFGPAGTWAYALGADLYAADARGAAEALLQRWPPVLRGESSVQADAVEAYATLVRQRPGLLEHLASALRDVCPDLRGRSGTEQEEGTGFLGRLLDSLAAAVFVDDEGVFTRHLAFVRTYLAARSADSRCLLALVDALTDRLHGSPRALDKLAGGRRFLVGQEDDSGRPG